MPDAKVFMDAAPDTAAVCSVMASLGALSLGTQAMPAAGDFFIVPMSGPNMGKTVFLLGGALDMNAARDVLAVEVVKPGTGGFLTNTPYNFNPDPNATYVAASYILEDLTMSAYARILYASSGSITFTAINEAINSNITGSVTATNYREINEQTGADVAGGCTSSLMGLTFNLTQNMARAEFPTWSGGGRPGFSPEELQAIAGAIDGVKAIQSQQ